MLLEVRMMMQAACPSQDVRCGAATQCGTVIIRDLAGVPIVALMVFAPEILAALFLITVIKQMHATALIRSKRSALQTIARCSSYSTRASSMIKRGQAIILFVIVLPLLEVAEVIPKEVKSNQS